MAESETGRKAVAKREFIDSQGNKVDDKMEATGARYTWLKSGFSIERQFNGDAATNACAAMGWLTKVGNVANTIVNGPGADPEADPSDSITEWNDQLSAGIWREKVEGAGLPRIDKDALAKAIVQVAPQDYQKVRDRLETDTAYVRKVRQHPKVLALYNDLTGRAKVSDEDLAA